MKWSGLYTALITPFTRDSLDEEGLRLLVRRQVESGVDGVVALGTTGEASTLTTREKERVISIVREELEEQRLIVGTGSFSTKATLEATEHAAALGADAALVIAPYYIKPTQVGLYKHFEKIATASSIPLFLYNNPGRTSVNIETPTLVRLAAHPNIVGVKETSGDLARVSALLNQVEPPFSLFAGDDVFALPFMALGGIGLISTASNIVPDAMKELLTACTKGDFTTARAIHHHLSPLFSALNLESNPIPIKAALELWELPAGAPRLPLTPLSEALHNPLQAALQPFQRVRV